MRNLQKANKDQGLSHILATEEVFETGFDPLAGGFRPARPYQVFDQWMEILPTDQVVAVQVNYNPKPDNNSDPPPCRFAFRTLIVPYRCSSISYCPVGTWRSNSAQRQREGPGRPSR